MNELFIKFEELFQKNQYSKKDTTVDKKTRTKLAILDDTVVLQMWHAICRLFFSNAHNQVFSIPLKLEFNPEFSVISKLRREVMKNKFEINQYFDLVRGSEPPLNIVSEPTMIAIGFYGSSVYGEWLNHWISGVDSDKSSNCKNIHFPKDKDIANVYFGYNFLTSLIASEINVVPTELFFEFYKHETNENGLLVHYIKKDQEKYLEIQVDNEFTDALKKIRDPENIRNEFYSDFIQFKNDDKIPEINILYNEKFNEYTLGKLCSLLTDKNSNFENCLRSFTELKTKNNDMKYIWDVDTLTENNLEGFIKNEEVEFESKKKEFGKIMEDMMGDLKSLDALATYFYYSFVKKDQDLYKNIKSIANALKINKVIKDEPRDIINFIKTIQFVNALSIALDVNEVHFYFPKILREESISEELPTIFLIFFGPYDSNVLTTIKDYYSGFIKIYEQTYLQSRYSDALDTIDAGIRGIKKEEMDKNPKLDILWKGGADPKKKLERGANFMNPMRAEYYFQNRTLMGILHAKIPLLLCDHVLISCLFTKMFLEETKVEHTQIKYSFLITNKKYNEIIQRKFCLESRTAYGLFYRSPEQEALTGYNWSTVESVDIFDRKENLFKAIGILKGHYTLINKENRIVGILPDDEKENGIKLYNILNLSLASFQQENSQITSSEILRKITNEIDGACGITVSEDGLVITFRGEVILTYNMITSKWEEPIERKTWEMIKKLVKTCFGDKNISTIVQATEIVMNTIKKISETYSYGAIFVIGDYSEIQNYSSNSFLIEEFSAKSLIDVKDDLFDIAIMDGATIIDVNSLEVHGRITLRPKFAFRVNEDNKDEPVEDFDIFKIKSGELDWDEKGKRYSLGTRHQNGLGMAFCTRSLIFVISSTGDVTAFYATGKNKIKGYSLLGLKNDKSEEFEIPKF